MNKSLKLLLLSASLFLSQLTYAICVQNNNSLNGLVGLDNSKGMVFATTISSTNECSCRHVRFREQNTDTKMALSILLSAKVTNQKVRIDLLDEGDCNSAYRVYLH